MRRKDWGSFEKDASPEAIEAHLKKARKRVYDTEREASWLQTLLFKRIAEKARGEWPGPPKKDQADD